jgi:hypothetical protein
MKLFQYWEPPDEVAEWIEGFRVKNPDFKHRLYDRGSASWFIRKNLGERHQRAFDALLVRGHHHAGTSRGARCRHASASVHGR